MGTSSLYRGPKKTILLPDDYTDNNLSNDSPVNDYDLSLRTEPSITWQSAKSILTKSVGNGRSAVRHALSSYTKSLGGYRNAAKSAVQARRVTSRIITIFTGTSAEIKAHLQAEGISFEGKTTEEVFLDIRDILAPTPNLLEDGYVNNAVTDAISDILKDTKVDIEQIDTVFNEELLSKLVCGTVTYYIYRKLINQATLGILKNEKSLVKIQKFEKEAKLLIDGIVKGTIPDLLHSGISSKEVTTIVTEIFEECYKVMEDFS